MSTSSYFPVQSREKTASERISPNPIPLPAVASPSFTANATLNESNTLYNLNSFSSHGIDVSHRIQTVHHTQYPPQPSSTGSVSANSSNGSVNMSPSAYNSPPYPGSSGQTELGSAYDFYAQHSADLSSRSNFPYHQYTSNYYGNVAMPTASTWFSHDPSLYQTWPPANSYSFNFEELAFQSQLQRRSARCSCPNCLNEMSGLPPVVGPDDRGRKQHLCHVPGCERVYGKASHLKAHIRWHTGERPFPCLACGKRFSRSDELQRHNRTHTNYRPYCCSICSKRFSRSDHLSKHKKIHFKDKKDKKAEKPKCAASPKKKDEAKTEAVIAMDVVGLAASNTATNNSTNGKTMPDHTVNIPQDYEMSERTAPSNATQKSGTPSSTSTSTSNSIDNTIPAGYSNIHQSTSPLFYNNHHQPLNFFYNRLNCGTNGSYSTDKTHISASSTSFLMDTINTATPSNNASLVTATGRSNQVTPNNAIGSNSEDIQKTSCSIGTAASSSEHISQSHHSGHYATPQNYVQANYALDMQPKSDFLYHDFAANNMITGSGYPWTNYSLQMNWPAQSEVIPTA